MNLDRGLDIYGLFSYWSSAGLQSFSPCYLSQYKRVENKIADHLSTYLLGIFHFPFYEINNFFKIISLENNR